MDLISFSSILLLIAGIAIGYFWAKSKVGPDNTASLQLQFAEEKSKIQQETAERYATALAQKEAALAQLEAFKTQLAESKQEQLQLEAKMKEWFKNISAEELNKQSESSSKRQHEELEKLLHPFKERLKEFETKVDQNRENAVKSHSQLLMQIEGLSKLNQQISEKAESLTKALTVETKSQGNWGELILDSILQMSGLEKDAQYRTQVVTQNSDGTTIKPDVVVYLPENKHIIVDSKVSLTAYSHFVEHSEQPESAASYLKAHVESIKTHIKQLSDKNYWSGTGLESPEFVLMFMPVEAAFVLAIKEDKNLFQLAWEKKIILVGPSTLLATLRTIEGVWKYEKLNQNALQIADRAGKLYDKVKGFVDDMNSIRKHIDKSQEAFDSAMNKLSTGRGNVVSQIEKMKQLGAKGNSQNLADDLVQLALESDDSED
ncbi:MAG: DNA recombination protein RmuC [Bacteroidetes bacterium]|nr:DNA recombination protein RmuC [Bacteroidota bacterium]MDA0942636.1 DNA recombination protein RmuC [Bacteroidota bacterium]MDA1111944.1 DNA recombination protein RmuC [Bacteroidota bacterium]